GMDLATAARPERREDLIGSEAGAGGQSHQRATLPKNARLEGFESQLWLHCVLGVLFATLRFQVGYASPEQAHRTKAGLGLFEQGGRPTDHLRPITPRP